MKLTNIDQNKQTNKNENISHSREFPGGPVVRTWRFHSCDPGSTPGPGTKIPQATCKPRGTAKKTKNKKTNKKQSHSKYTKMHKGKEIDILTLSNDFFVVCNIYTVEVMKA